MGESEYGCSDCPIPGDSPVPSVLDQFCRFDRSKSDLEIPDLLNLGIIVCGGELPAEDCVKIDSPAGDDVLPFGVRKFRTVWFVNEGTFCCFGIDGVDLDELESLCKSVSQDSPFVLPA